MSAVATIAEPRTLQFDPEGRAYSAYALGGTKLLGSLAATALDHATAEATERWHWDRGDRLGIRETGQEDAPIWPFEKQPLDRLHVYAVRRSAPLRWEPTADLMRMEPVYRFKLELICTIDLLTLAGTQTQSPSTKGTSGDRNPLVGDQ